MRYENFKKAEEIVKKLDKLLILRQDLMKDDISIIISNGHELMTIGTWSTCEHSHKGIACDFKKVMLYEVNSKIDNLHYELASL